MQGKSGLYFDTAGAYTSLSKERSAGRRVVGDSDYKRTELRLKQVNTILAVFGGLGVIASVYFGFSQLQRQSAAQTRAIEQQWNNTFYDERMKLYARATEAAGRIASLVRKESDQAEIDGAIIEFRTLFWGPMCITEGTDVESAMVKFNTGISSNAGASALEQLALRLAHVCKNETHAYYLTTDQPASRYGTNAEILSQMDDIIKKARETTKKTGSDAE